jgi:hypothetical protein
MLGAILSAYGEVKPEPLLVSFGVKQLLSQQQRMVWL